MPLEIVRRAWPWLESVENQVSPDVGRIVQAPKSDLMARGVAFDLLQVAERIGPRCEAADYEDLSGEKGLALDCAVDDGRRSHRAYR